MKEHGKDFNINSMNKLTSGLAALGITIGGYAGITSSLHATAGTKLEPAISSLANDREGGSCESLVKKEANKYSEECQAALTEACDTFRKGEGLSYYQKVRLGHDCGE